MPGFSWSSVGGVTAEMVVVEMLEQGLTTLAKASMARGMTSFVFVIYSNSLAVLILLPAIICFHRRRPLPKISLSIISRIHLQGLLGCIAQVLMYIGIGYSSPTLASAMNDLIPAFTFVLAVISRMEKIDLRIASSVAKFTGTLVSIIGALTITLLKGLPLIDNGSTTTLQEVMLPQSSWITGAMFLASSAFALSLLYIVQTWTIRDYPAELVVALGSCTSTALNTSALALILERDPKAWRLKHGIELIAVGYAAIFGVSIRNVAHAWACRMEGPLYVSMFKPLGMAFAIAMGVSFLKDTLYLGSVIGAVIIAVGFYAVIWGKAEEEKGNAERRPICKSNDQTPLLSTKLEI